ncbi:MAG TPA: hypothetical protein VMQ62_07225 [Dongiaceae bacterium]|nr:hypothetical protein [Dongiaceae bacterium]
MKSFRPGHRPYHKRMMVSDLRKRHEEVPSARFEQVPLICRGSGLAKPGPVAVDGTGAQNAVAAGDRAR